MKTKHLIILSIVGLLGAACNYSASQPNLPTFTGPQAFWDKPQPNVSNVSLLAGPDGFVKYGVVFHCADPTGVNSAEISLNEVVESVLGVNPEQAQPGNTLTHFKHELQLPLGVHKVEVQCENSEGEKGQPVSVRFNVVGGGEAAPPETEAPPATEPPPAEVATATDVPPTRRPTATSTVTSSPTPTLGPVRLILPTFTPIPPPN